MYFVLAQDLLWCWIEADLQLDADLERENNSLAGYRHTQLHKDIRRIMAL